MSIHYKSVRIVIQPSYIEYHFPKDLRDCGGGGTYNLSSVICFVCCTLCLEYKCKCSHDLVSTLNLKVDGRGSVPDGQHKFVHLTSSNHFQKAFKSELRTIDFIFSTRSWSKEVKLSK